MADAGSSQRAAPMSNPYDPNSEKNNVDHKRTLSDPSCTHDQLTKRLRMTLPFERFSALLPLGKTDNGEASPETHAIGNERTALTHCPNDGGATESIPVITPGGGDDQHSVKENAAPTASSAQESLTADPDLASEIDDFITSVRDEIRVKQEGEAESDRRVSTALPSFSPRAPVVADASMNPARAAMIATTATPQQTKEVRFVEGGGPQKSGMNDIPLGQRKLAGTSQRDPGVQPSNAVQPYSSSTHVGGAQPRPAMPWSQPGVPPFQFQFHGADQYRPSPQFNAPKQPNPRPKSTHPMRTRNGKKRGAGGSVSSSSSTQTVINQFNGFANGHAGLRSNQESKVVKRAQQDIKRAQQEIIWDELRGSIRMAIRKVYTSGRARTEANVQAHEAINALHAIIVGNSKLLKRDDDGYEDEDMPSANDAKPLMLTPS